MKIVSVRRRFNEPNDQCVLCGGYKKEQGVYVTSIVETDTLPERSTWFVHLECLGLLAGIFERLQPKFGRRCPKCHRKAPKLTRCALCNPKGPLI